jgi:endonuclease/exonuclease/phosphatase family metal-dependent hydrolase
LDLSVVELHLFSSPLLLSNAFQCCLSVLHLNGSISSSKRFRLVVLYRPPTSSKTPQFSVFLSKFTGLLEALNQAFGDVVITGDFNIHVGSGETNADDFEQLLVSFIFSQLVKAPTRRAKSGKWQKLDLILTRESSNLVTKKHTTLLLDASVTSRLSDHHAVQCSLNITPPPRPFKSVTYSVP